MLIGIVSWGIWNCSMGNHWGASTSFPRRAYNKSRTISSYVYNVWQWTWDFKLVIRASNKPKFRWTYRKCIEQWLILPFAGLPFKVKTKWFAIWRPPSGRIPKWLFVSSRATVVTGKTALSQMTDAMHFDARNNLSATVESRRNYASITPFHLKWWPNGV